MFWKPLFLLLLVFLIGCALQPVTDPRQPSPENEPTAVPTAATIEKPTYTVETGTVVSEKILSGRVVPQQQTLHEFKTSGRVTEVLVKRDDVVVEGDVLIRLDTEDLEQALAFAQTNLELAQAQLEEVGKAIANQLFLAEIDRDQIQISLDYTIQQAGTAVSTDEQLQIDLLTLDLKRAQFAVDQLTDTIDPALEAQVAQAQLELDQLQAEVEKSTLVASTGGTILSITPKVGDVVIENETVVIIADLSQVEVNAITPGCDLNELAEGMSVTLLRSNEIGDPILLTIYEMPAPFGSAEQPADGSCPVRISFDNVSDSEGFEVGERVTMNAQLDEQQDVLWLPPAAVREFNGRSFVVIQEGATQKRIDITIGLQNNQRVEVETGLEEGQIVIGP